MTVFWARGYRAASLDDLTDATGVKRGSLYAAFGDKQGLFLAALDRYARAGLTEMGEILGGPGSPKEAIRAWLLRYARASSGADGERGCLLTSTALELLPRDPAAAERVARTFRRIEDLLVGTIIRGQAQGEITSRRDERALARFLLVTLEGMRVLGKTAPDERAMRDLADVALDALG